jgi:hypothetical protein
LRLVLLWFGTWKNGQSNYLPDWVKRDFERFPRAQIVGGAWPVFGGGEGRPTDDIFMAWHFARYVGRVVEAGKAEYPIPMITNCPQSGFGTAQPGCSTPSDAMMRSLSRPWLVGSTGERLPTPI